jgi:glycosyltransferase involved in cell wall biosynthesis
VLSIIIPAYNEESVIEDCLISLLKQTFEGDIEIVVSANGCCDRTAELAKNFDILFARKGYDLVVLETEKGNKNNALNRADKIAKYPMRMYLDADVVCDPALIEEIIDLLHDENPVYASGTLAPAPGNSYASSAYGNIWKEIPYIRETVPGCGCYAVNAAGRGLWRDFPPIISDDKFVRLLFEVRQRKQAFAKYYWPIPQGYLKLIKIRTRWSKGNRQLAFCHPELLINDCPRFRIDRSFVRILVRNPVSSIVFFSICVIAALRAYSGSVRSNISWHRAR